MNVILDGEPRDVDTSRCANLAELVATAEAFEQREEEFVVVGVEVNGEALPPDALSVLETRSLEGVDCVAIERRPTLAVARSVVAQGADYTHQIGQAIAQAVDHYRSSRSDLAHAILADVTDSLTVLTGITYSVSSFLVEESKALAKLQGEIAPWLETLFEAQQSEDPTAIADILEYEIAPRIAEWGVEMRSLVEPSVGLSN